ncbi:Two-component sensor histidine kinase, contains HisKA and HATPase domains [Palleronia pelagia]|uniref:histidine kinase n=1 Tax=Palleronia pelagia TaxID=387096 RepID=A0A1H8ESM7_9RHOB|nr:Two-component sensor histidine kinase, contains HisKA and HATPase domains [Palleronia pelagia]
MLPGGRGIDGLDRLDVRLVALLGLALLPIGLIAMVQTYRVIDNADEVARAALIGHTVNAVTDQREALVQMRGAARIAAEIVATSLEDQDACSANMVRFTRRFPSVSFAGYVDNDGLVRCASSGIGTDLSDNPVYRRWISEDAGFFASSQGAVSGMPVVSVVEPVRIDGRSIGFFGVSIPQAPLNIGSEEAGIESPLATLTMTRTGEVLSLASAASMTDILPLLPDFDRFRGAIFGGARQIVEEGPDGRSYIYTTVPIIPGEIFAMSIWRSSAVSTGGLTAASAILFPLLMWLVSIGVAYFAVHRLVVRHIRQLRLRIRAFTTTRRVLPFRDGGDLPSELREVVEAFEQLTERILRDEADLENSLHEKDVLLKEVHHRVKNNLQLISSMMNMQLRKTTSEETRSLIRRLQDRVLGLATIHRNLYRANVLSRVDSAQLIADLVDQITANADVSDGAIDLQTDIQSVALYPDQAVPLSLLVTETLTNAFKYVGSQKDERPWIKLGLTESEGTVTLCCENSLGPRFAGDAGLGASGLGSQLMQAFVMQLDGRMTVRESEGRHTVTLVFDTSEFTDEL